MGFIIQFSLIGSRCWSVPPLRRAASVLNQFSPLLISKPSVPFDGVVKIVPKNHHRSRRLQPSWATPVLQISPLTNSRISVTNHYGFVRHYCSKANKETEKHDATAHTVQKKPSLLQRFKQMYREYWYVLLPVHIITSVGWFGGFYYLAKSGVDVVALLQSLGVSEKLVSPLKDSSAGYLAIAYALYKIATPLRYTVTLGGTTVSIKYLKEWGYLKPIPPREKLKEMYNEKKDQLIRETAHRREQIKEKTGCMIRSVRRKEKQD